MMFGAAALGVIGLMVIGGYLPREMLMVYCVTSLATLAAYWRDKVAARQGDRRIPERFLHLLSLLGGWPGARIGQQLFRHKRQKTAFMWVYWTTALLNGLAVGWLFVWPALQRGA